MPSETHKIISLHAGYKHNGVTVDSYVARPIAPGTHPAVLLISGMSGLNSFQREITREFARAGFVTLSPDLFDGYSAPDHASALLAKNSLDINATVERLASGADWLRQLPWVEDNAPIGVIGFCLGGGLALLCVGRTEAFGAGVIYYQSLFPDPSELSGISTKLLCHYGTEDKSTPAEEIERFRAHIDWLGIQNEIHMYPGVGHSFLNPSQDSSINRTEAATLSLERTFTFLREEIGNTSNNLPQSELAAMPDEDIEASDTP